MILYRDGPGEVICPHAVPFVLRDPQASMELLYQYLEACGVQYKTLFGSLPTQHGAFGFLGYREGQFPVAERIGRTGWPFSVHQYLTDEEVEFVAGSVKSYVDARS